MTIRQEKLLDPFEEEGWEEVELPLQVGDRVVSIYGDKMHIYTRSNYKRIEPCSSTRKYIVKKIHSYCGRFEIKGKRDFFKLKEWKRI